MNYEQIKQSAYIDELQKISTGITVEDIKKIAGLKEIFNTVKNKVVTGKVDPNSARKALRASVAQRLSKQTGPISYLKPGSGFQPA